MNNTMWKNYIKIGFRSLLKNKLYTGINLLGLSIGLGVGILIFLYIQQETSFDTFHTNESKLYRVLRIEQWVGEEESSGPSVPIVLATALGQNITGIDSYTRWIDNNALAKTDNDDTFNQVISMVSPGFFEMFDFKMVSGMPLANSQDRNSIVLTESGAEKYFGNEPALGKTLRLQMADNYIPYTVKGVIENPPANSSMQFEMLMLDDNVDLIFSERAISSWFNVYGDTYVMLKDGVTPSDLVTPFQSMMKNALGERAADIDYKLQLQPLTDIHLNDKIPTGNASVANPRLLWVLGGIALLIILIASINFTTMAIGKSVTRAKEVGVRKTMGAGFGQLFFQFITEAIIITVLALLIGVIMAEVLLPIFNQLLNTQLVIHYSLNQVLILILLASSIALLSGSYPALFLASFKPTKVLKGTTNLNFGKIGLRKGLLGFQFFISISLISATVIMYQQMEEIRNYDLGLDHEAVLQINIPPPAANGLGDMIQKGFEYGQRMKNELKSQPDVIKQGLATSVYGDDSWINVGFQQEDGNTFYFNLNVVDENYADLMGFTFLQGRNFSADIPSDKSSGFIVNEAMANLLGWDAPVGETLPGTSFGENRAIGVVKNFHFESLYSKIEPAMMVMDVDNFFAGFNNIMISTDVRPKLFVKLQSNDLEVTLAKFQQIWSDIYGADPFEYSFFDDAIEREYAQDERLSQMISIAAVIAIVISGMGLFALASLSIASRLKEIGIRKVLGASTTQISLLFNKEFIKVTLVGIFLSIPITYWMMNEWLNQFIIKVPLGVGVFSLSLLAGVIFSIVIVSWQTISASWSNPVSTLKND